jgi:hypothetical protein
MSRGQPALVAAGVLFGGIALAAILMSLDLVFLSIIVGACAVPGAFIAWIIAGDRAY